MITATRCNHVVTRNSRHFKTISDTCYDKALDIILRARVKSSKIKYIIYPREELVPYQNNVSTPPPTPNVPLDLIRTPSSPPAMDINVETHPIQEHNVQQAIEPTSSPAGHSMERRSSFKQGRVSYTNAYRMFPKSILSDINENP